MDSSDESFEKRVKSAVKKEKCKGGEVKFATSIKSTAVIGKESMKNSVDANFTNVENANADISNKFEVIAEKNAKITPAFNNIEDQSTMKIMRKVKSELRKVSSPKT